MTDRAFGPYLDSIIRAFVAAYRSNRQDTDPGDLAPLPPFGSPDWLPYERAALAAVVADTDAGAPRATHFAFHRYDPPCDSTPSSPPSGAARSALDLPPVPGAAASRRRGLPVRRLSRGMASRWGRLPARLPSGGAAPE